MPDVNKEINILGLYGSIVATLSIFLSLYNLLRDRARISIKCQTDQYLLGDGASVLYNQKDPSQKYIIITVINKGRRPIKIEQAAFKIFRQKKWSILVDSFSLHRPKVINEEMPQTTFIAEQQLIDFKNVIYIRVQDGAGRVYRKYIKKFPTIYIIVDWFINKFSKDESDK